MTEIFIKAEDRFIKIDLAEIVWFEAIDNYVKLHTQKRVYIVHTTLKQLEEKLPGNKFCRVHKSFIVSISHIISFDKEEVELADKTLPLGRSYRDHLKQQIVWIAKEASKDGQD